MVQSQTTSISPAAHAANHIHGASDPLTGDVRIDAMAPAAHITSHELGGTDPLVVYETSADVIFDSSVQKSTANGAYTKTKEIIYVGTPETLRTIYSYYKRQTAITGYRLYINGVAQGTERLPGAGSNTWYQSDESVAVVDGDLIQVYSKTNYAGTEVSGVKDFKILGKLPRKPMLLTANDP